MPGIWPRRTEMAGCLPIQTPTYPTPGPDPRIPTLHRQADLLAGLTVGVMTVPQALSYARIAGLPSEYGLYGAFTPVLAYAVFGSSPQLVRGSCA